MSSPSYSTAAEVSAAAFWRRGLLVVVVGALAAGLYGWVIDLAGVPMRAGGPGATEAQNVGPANFAAGTAILTLVGLGLAAAMRRRAGAPRGTFLATTGVLTAVSLMPVTLAGATTTSTKLAFALGHVLLALLVVPLIARTLPTRQVVRQPILVPSVQQPENRVHVMPRPGKCSAAG